jgi:predicted DNA binding CopG/RHH family protein
MEPVIGERGNKYMRSKIKYSNEPIGKIKIIKDFLPSPEDLVFKDKNVRITINLRKSSVDFFKEIAGKNRTPYQKVIRSLLDYYATHAI